MPRDRGNRGKRYPKNTYQSIRHFNVNDYVQHPPMIENLHEENVWMHEEIKEMTKLLELTTASNHDLKLQKQEYELRLHEAEHKAEKLNLEKELIAERLEQARKSLEASTESNHELRLQNQEFRLRLQDADQRLADVNRRSVLKYLLTLIATLILGTGINLVVNPSGPYYWIGWIAVPVGSILDIIAFFIPSSRK
jgi:hypothetical protein